MLTPKKGKIVKYAGAFYKHGDKLPGSREHWAACKTFVEEIPDPEPVPEVPAPVRVVNEKKAEFARKRKTAAKKKRIAKARSKKKKAVSKKSGD
jgi:hypothetical protein